MKITLPANLLAWLLNATIPHASREDLTPVIESVLIGWDGTALTATTTDRYTLAHARYRPALTVHDDGTRTPQDVEGDPVEALLAWDYARMLAAILRVHGKALAVLDVDRDRVVLSQPHATSMVHTLPSRWADNGTLAFPKWRPLIDGFLNAEPASESIVVGLSGEFLARWKHAAPDRATPLVVSSGVYAAWKAWAAPVTPTPAPESPETTAPVAGT